MSSQSSRATSLSLSQPVQPQPQQSQHQGQVQPRRHIIKACEGCRAQKIKCNGASPCERCARLNLPCNVRSVARKRRRDAAPKRPSESDSDVFRMALRPVRVADASGRTSVYGPSSTVALLRMLSGNGNASSGLGLGAMGSEDGMNSGPGFNFMSGVPIDSLKFDPLAYHPYSYNPSPTLGMSLTPPLCLTTIPSQVLQLFLTRYIGTAWAILPLQTPGQLTTLFGSSCAAFSHNAPPPALYPILLYQLAMGSLVTMQGGLAELLVQESEFFMSAGTGLPEVLDLQLHYYREVGHFEKAYSMLGLVATKVFTAGFHLEPQSPEVASLVRSLLSAETFVCIALGRPPLLSHTIQASTQNEPPSSQFLSTLFNILTPSLKLQQTQCIGLDELWTTIWSTHAKLKAFWEESEPAMLDPCTDSHRRRVGESRALKAGLYEYAILINLRPVLLYIGHKNFTPGSSSPGSASASSSRRSTSATAASRTTPTPETTTKITLASKAILSSSQNIIANIAEVRQRGSLAKELPMNSYYLETACLSLIAYGVWHGNAAAVWDSLYLGIHCLEQLRYQGAAARRLEIVRGAMEALGRRG